jgi:hypothetical protein
MRTLSAAPDMALSFQQLVRSISAGGGASNGTLQLPQRIQDLIGGNLITVVNGVITLGFTPSALAPVTPINTFYVDVDAANDSGNGLSDSTPKGYIHSAVTLANAGGQPARIVVDGTGGKVYPRGRNFHNGTTLIVPTVPIHFVSTGGKAVIINNPNGTWTVHSGTTYRKTYTGVTRCANLIADNADGTPVAFVELASAAAVVASTPAATSGAWYDSGTTVYVKRGDGAAVTNTNTATLLSTSGGGAANSTSGNSIFENFRFLGGNEGCLRLGNNATGRVYAADCEFHYAKVAGGDIDSVRARGIVLTILERCKSSVADKDAFNFNDSGGVISNAILVDCEGYENGYYPTNTSCNGPTMHGGGALLDIRGTYSRNHGASCAHIHTDSIGAHIGTSAVGDYGDEDRGGATGQAAGVGFIALTGSTLYHYACDGVKVASGGTLVDLAVAA